LKLDILRFSEMFWWN